MVILRTGASRTKNMKIDYQGSKKKSIKNVKESIHIIGYIKAGTDRKNNQIYWFDSNESGRVYVIADKELHSLGFYNYKYKTKDLKILGIVYKNNNLKIKEILE